VAAEGATVTQPQEDRRPPKRKPEPADPWNGTFKEVMTALATTRARKALELAQAWRARTPGDYLAWDRARRAYEARHMPELAERAYGSLIDLYSERADMRRYAASRLETLGGARSLALAIDCLHKAREQRADHPSSHHLLAMALVKAGRYDQALSVLQEALATPPPDVRFPGAARMLREDLAAVAAAWGLREPSRRDTLTRELASWA